MKWFENNQDLFWKSVLFLGIALNLVALIISDNGLDYHVKSSYVEVEEGYSLDWGDVRLDNPNASDPNDATIFSVKPITTSGKAMAGFCIAILAAMALLVDKRFAGLILLNPAMIFSVGKGYDEPAIAVLMGMVVTMLYLSNKMKENWLIKSFAGLPLVVILLMKNPSPSDSLLIPTILLIILIGCSCIIPVRLLRPRLMLGIGFSLGAGLILLLGILQMGTHSIITEETGRFLFSIPFALLDTVIIYGIFAMVIWPFAKSTWQKMATSEDRLAGELSFLIGGFSGVIMMYVAVLWTYESVLWGSSWPWHMVTMGNNGRYITLLIIPAYMLVKQVNGEIDWQSKKVFFGIVLILPFSLLAGLHGQTMWTDDAAQSMDIQQNQDFLFVSEATLAMHWLYTFHEPLDAEEKNITGYWRSDTSSWNNDLDEDLSHIDWLVLAPEIEGNPNGWELYDSGEVDFLNGGGEWRVFKRA